MDEQREELINIIESNIDILDTSIVKFLTAVRNDFCKKYVYIYEEQSEVMLEFLQDVFDTNGAEETAKAVMNEAVNREGYFKINDIDNFVKRLTAAKDGSYRPTDFDESILMEWYEPFIESGFDLFKTPGQEWSYYGNKDLPSLYAVETKSIDTLVKANLNYYVAVTTYNPDSHEPIKFAKAGEHYAFNNWLQEDVGIRFRGHATQVRTKNPIVYVPLGLVKATPEIRAVDCTTWLTKPIIDKYNLPVWEG